MSRLMLSSILAGLLLIGPNARAADIPALPTIAADAVEILTVDQLTSRSADGDAKAQAELGARYARGDGVESNMAKALALFEQSAAKGEANGQYYLATAYYMGTGTKQDSEKAAQLFAKAASNNHAGGQLSLGIMMTDGQGGLKADPKAAVDYIRKSAEQGFIPAAFQLSQLYIGGTGVEKNPDQAAYWLRRILKSSSYNPATVSLLTLIETREVTWQPGDPGSAPTSASPDMATVGVETQQVAAAPSRINPNANYDGPMKIESFDLNGFPVEARTRDGYVGLFGTSSKPYECRLEVRFSWVNADGERVPGDYICYRQFRAAGSKALICESRHDNFVQTKIEGLDLKDCDPPPSK